MVSVSLRRNLTMPDLDYFTSLVVHLEPLALQVVHPLPSHCRWYTPSPRTAGGSPPRTHAAWPGARTSGPAAHAHAPHLSPPLPTSAHLCPPLPHPLAHSLAMPHYYPATAPPRHRATAPPRHRATAPPRACVLCSAQLEEQLLRDGLRFLDGAGLLTMFGLDESAEATSSSSAAGSGWEWELVRPQPSPLRVCRCRCRCLGSRAHTRGVV